MQKKIDKVKIATLIEGAKNALEQDNESRLNQIIKQLNQIQIIEDGNVSAAVEEYVKQTRGWFTTKEVYGDLNLRKSNEKRSGLQKLIRMTEEGKLERSPDRNGVYRQKRQGCEEVRWWEASGEEYDIRFPFEIERWVKIFPGSIIVIGGSVNSGKTAFMLNLIRMNIEQHHIYYFNSEMGSNELQERINLIQDINTKTWTDRMTVYERSSDFDSVVFPNGFNIIDFLEVHDVFYQVGEKLLEIHNNLKNGIAVIGLQMNPGSEYGRGGSFSSEKPRLYITLDRGKLKIVKAKNWRSGENPNGWTADFRLVAGNRFIIDRQLEPEAYDSKGRPWKR